MRKMCEDILIASVILMMCGLSKAIACSVIFLDYKDYPVIGRNFDWDPGKMTELYVKVTPAAVKHNGQLTDNRDKEMSWDVRYKSIAFAISMQGQGWNKPIILDGINEKGLYVGDFYLKSTEYCASGSKKRGMSILAFPQYLLDNCKTVKDAAEKAKGVAVYGEKFGEVPVNLHFFICDKSGDSAIIEFIKGQTVVYFPTDVNGISVKAITNDPPYNQMKEILQGYEPYHSGNLSKLNFEYLLGHEGRLPDGSMRSDARLSRLFLHRLMLMNDTKPKSMDEALAMVQTAIGISNDGPATFWSSLINLKDGEISFRSINNPYYSIISMHGIDVKADYADKFLKIDTASRRLKNSSVDFMNYKK